MKMKSFAQSIAPVAVLASLLSGAATISPSHALYAAATPTTSTRAFHVEGRWELGGVGGWGLPALDSSAHLLYIPRNNRVMVVDTKTGSLVTEIGGMQNVREMVLDDAGKYGYVTDPTDGSDGFVRVFDRATHQLVASIPTGRVPAGIAFDAATKSVFAFNSHDHSATVIDATTNQVTATIPLEGRPASAISDGKGNIYVTLPALGEITRIDAAQKKVVTSWPLGTCTGPAGLSIDSAHRQLFTTCEDHKLVSVNADNGHVAAIADAPIGAGDLDFDPRHNMLFLADINGTLTVYRRISPTRYAVSQRVKTQPGARTLIVNHLDDKAFLATSKFDMNTTTKSEELQFRPTPVPGSFSIIVVGR